MNFEVFLCTLYILTRKSKTVNSTSQKTPCTKSPLLKFHTILSPWENPIPIQGASPTSLPSLAVIFI